MSEDQTNYVCDVSLVMRTRLLCGLYSGRAVPPRWRPLARAYCVAVAVTILAYTIFMQQFYNWQLLILWISCLYLYLFNVFVALWSGDEMIYRFFTYNPMTDDTLDSPAVFGHLQILMRKTYLLFVSLNVVFAVIRCMRGYIYKQSLTANMLYVIPLAVLEFCMMSVHATKVLVAVLFEARLLVLKRRLQRYGFRSVGRRLQPYCQIYHQILKGLEATDNPLKLLLFFDVIFCCSNIIACVLSTVQDFKTEREDIAITTFEIIAIMLRLAKSVVEAFGHVTVLESAVAHCDYMAEFTCTELIKTPTAEQRQHMRTFLDALELRGAQYHVLRALPLDGRFVLCALGFCSAQVVVLVSLIGK